MITCEQLSTGKQVARCQCDFCEDFTDVSVSFGSTKNFDKISQTQINNVNTVFQSLKKRGWSYIGKKMRCKDCEEKRRSKGETKMTKDNVKELRQPTKEQKREIIDLLTAVYDVSAQRYKGSETDKSVAETIGNGIMWGWVANLREDFFGPDGNEQAEQVSAEITQWMETADGLAKQFHEKLTELQKSLREFNAARQQVAKMADDVKKVKGVA